MNANNDEGKLISGKEALIALANGKDVEFEIPSCHEWRDIKSEPWNLDIILNDRYNHKFRLKPRTITINGIEVPAPFKPKVGEKYFYLAHTNTGYDSDSYESTNIDECKCQFGAWRTEEEIKQIVAFQRQVFGGAV